METFLTWNDVIFLLEDQNKSAKNPLGKLHSMLIEKQFPLPVKNQKGTIVFVKSEVDDWLLPKRKRKENKSGRYKSDNVS
jgi:hypothetical protein